MLPSGSVAGNDFISDDAHAHSWDPGRPRSDTERHAREMQAKLLHALRSRAAPAPAPTQPPQPHSGDSMARFFRSHLFVSHKCDLCSDPRLWHDLIVRLALHGPHAAPASFTRKCSRLSGYIALHTHVFAPCSVGPCERLALTCIGLAFLGVRWRREAVSTTADKGRSRHSNKMSSTFRPSCQCLSGSVKGPSLVGVRLAITVSADKSRPTRPSQIALPHDRAIDILPWPSLRERLCFERHSAVSDTFHAAHMRCIRLYWPQSLSSGIYRNPVSGLYSMTDDFKACVLDINHWRIDDSFLLQFPRYETDVLTMSTLPAFILLWKGPGRTAEEQQAIERAKIKNRRVAFQLYDQDQTQSGA